MRTFIIIATLLSVLLGNSHYHATYATEASHDNDDQWSSFSALPNSTASLYPKVILSSIHHNVTATIVVTPPIGSIPARTWIRFDNGPMVEIDGELTLESIEAAYNRTVGKNNDQASGLLVPFSFESSFAEHDVTSLEILVYLSSQDRGALLLEPNHGPSSGGTRVYVKGITSGRIVNGPQALCKFGKHISQAIEVGSNGEFVVCISPPRSVNDHVVTVPVDVSLSGQSFVSSGEHVVFRYDDDITVSSLYPTSGVVIGGTKVNIRGGPFQNPDEIVCRFGDKTVGAIYHDISAISCISPHHGWIEEVQRVSVFTMAANPEIQTISVTVEDYVNEIHICQTFGRNLGDDEFGRGFRLVAPGGSIEYPLTHHTPWIHYNESANGMREALLETGLFLGGTHVDRTGPFPGGTYRWEIVLPKRETFNGQTLHVVDSGGGAVQLKGENATVTCVLSQRGTRRLEGVFRLFSSNNGLVESSRLIPHNATNDDIKMALEALNGIDTVHVQSTSLDFNMTGSGAVQWHVTFDSLKNAGDVPLLIADYTSSDAKLFGSNATIDIRETRKGASHAIYKIEIPTQTSKFSIILDDIESRFLLVGATPSEVAEAVEAIGGESIVVEKCEAEYFFLDITGYPLEGRLNARIIQCAIDDASPSCSTELHNAIQHVPSTANQLGGHFSLRFQPSNLVPCKTCRHSTTEAISSFATALQVETAISRLDFVDAVEVVITQSKRNKEYKVPITSGIVGLNRNFYIRFIQNKAHPVDVNENLLFYSTGYSGDVPLLSIKQDHLEGTPTRESAHSNDYNAIVTEVLKGTDFNHGGIVEVAVSINNGVDFSEQNSQFEYKPVPIVQSIMPACGSVTGNTAIRVSGDNFSRNSARYCLFWGLGASVVGGAPSGLIEYVPISKYSTSIRNKTFRSDKSAISEVVCTSPASLKPQYVNLAVVSDDDISSLESSIRGKLFRYHQDIKISNIYPVSSSVAGNVSVTISGGPFFSNDGLFCSFGGVIVPGVLRSPNQISCNAPLHVSGTYSFEVTQNGQDFIKSGHTFRYDHTCSISNISPMAGPSRRAGTNVKVLGENFVNMTHLQCRFGMSSVPATFVSSNEISCSSPPIESSSLDIVQMAGYYPQLIKGHIVSLEVSNNGQDFTSNGHQFLYLEDIEEPHVSMRELQLYGKGTPTIIRGRNFVNSTQLTCRFRNGLTRAFFLTREAILCFSPPDYGLNYIVSGTKESLPLAVSNNGADYVYVTGLKHASKILGGMFQAGREGSTLLMCPRGAYCDGSVLGNNFTLCNPGTYQPLAGQSSCIQCPIGYVCNEFGMTVPRICPAHFLCDVRGLASAKPCPTNYICDRGTATLASACVNTLDVGSEICFDNSTDDFGLQSSEYPAQVWAERHLMPLDAGSPITPIRGRYCYDTACINHDDSDNFQVFDKSFDYSSTGFRLKRPKCMEGTACDPGTLPSSRLCSKGHYCRSGVKIPCSVGTYCPHDNMFDPLHCEPGTFNFMVGQDRCSDCPIGYYCPDYGLIGPVICPPGFVCSKKGLRRPNIQCPAGFYCHNGTKTSDPFRNDTTLRPYACSPGTFCVAGTGSNEVREGAIGFAQPCTAGFFCEAASISAKGSGACPPSFECPKGTANPRPTPKGFHAEHPGTIESTACLPGFYAPTIQTDQCYECPPGTSCTFEGLFQAEECGPGTYRSTDLEGGKSCVPCPQGTWSKNWGLREQGECTRCPTGVVCPIDGMTQPCSYADLPTPFEPVVNFEGLPEFEYMFPSDSRPFPFSMDECLALNSNRVNSTSPEYFFGELVPPYIDILGRGPHFRSSDQASLKFQSTAKCYKNLQPHGSLLYMRMADYYGPQYDIQTGHPHQGYGISFLYNQIYATAPPEGYDFSFSYFRGQGNGYIDLPKARIYNPAFNCTKGFQLMNSSLMMKGVEQVVYTDPVNDFEGGHDVDKCPFYDSELSCFVADSFSQGECCNISKYEQRAIYLAQDQFYSGTCEADLICSEGGLAPSQAKPCDSGFVCDERTSLDSSMNYRCPAGFVCDFATTPDVNLWAPGSQLKTLCKEGHYCRSDDLGHQRHEICPRGFWCPTGTADPIIGSLTNDGLLRLLHNSRESPNTNLQYNGGDTFVLRNDHDNGCDAATISSLETRFRSMMHDSANMNHLKYLSEQNKLPIAVNEATPFTEQCSRDNKSVFVRDAMRRNECNCHSQFFTLASVYRLWKCTSNSPLEDLGLGDTVVPPSGLGKRDFWYPNSRIHKDSGSAVFSRENSCVFNDSIDYLTLTEGSLPDENDLPNISTLLKHPSNYLDLRSMNGFLTRFAGGQSKMFESYAALKHAVTAEFRFQREQTASGDRINIDPQTFAVYHSIRLIEQFGQRLENFIHLNATDKITETSIELIFGNGNDTYSTWFDFVAPLDWCECQNLLRCPNGTSSSEGSTNLADCVSTKNEVLHRITLLPPVFNTTPHIPSTALGTVDESTTLVLEPFDVAVLTVDQSLLPSNISYGDHYRISIYDGCKPCPIQYQCKADESAKSSGCIYPASAEQWNILNECLIQNRKNVCLRRDGSLEDVGHCQSQLDSRNATNHSFLLLSEPDLEKCLSQPYFCADISSKFHSFRRLCQDKMENGIVSPIYDCSDVSRWHTYSRWRDEICCAQVPELRGVESCRSDSVCDDNPLIEKIIRDTLIGVFESEYGFIPPLEERRGQLLMNASMQEDVGNARPIELFKEHTESFKETHLKTSTGCCECRRHTMPAFFASNTQVSGFPDDEHQPIQLAISALARVELTVVAELLHGAYYTDFRNYFGAMNRSMLRVHSPGRFAEGSGSLSTWLAVVQPHSSYEKNFDLPLNLPLVVKDGIISMEKRFLVDRPSNISIGDHRLFGANDLDADPQRSRYFIAGHPTRDSGTVLQRTQQVLPDFLALPYLPFFSNCDGYDSHIAISRLLEEHPDCTGVEYSRTIPITDFGPRHPVGDSCLGMVLNCTYEEDVREARANLRWFEATSGSTLFHITRDAVSSRQYVPSNAIEEWGMTGALEDVLNRGLIPVFIDKELGGYRHAIPRKVTLEMRYFQVSRGHKRLVEANLYFEDLCTTQTPEHVGGSTNVNDMMQERGILPCDVDVNGNMKSRGYNLVIQYYPLGWFDLLNSFELGTSVYIVLFTLVGTIVCAMGGFAYGINRLFTKLRHPPKFMGPSFVKLASWPQIQGLTLAMIPYAAAILVTFFLFTHSALTFPEVHRSWSRWGKVGDDETIENSMGRLGSALIILGIYSISRAAMKLIPNTQARRVGITSDLDSDASNSVTAKRAHFIGVCLTIEAMLLCLWEFSYSAAFRNNIYVFKVVFQLCQVVLDVAVSFVMGDRLLAAPILVSIQMSEMLVTIGARNSVEFTLCFLVEMALLVVQRLFLYPLVHRILILLPRWKILASEALRLDGVTRQDQQLRELTWKKVNENIELRSEGVEPLLHSLSLYSVEKTGVMLLPFMHFLLALFYIQSEMANNYDINQQELLYYGLFAMCLVPWMSVFDSFILSSQELLYGWKVQDYLSYQRLRFASREWSWSLLGPVDESVAPALQNVDLLCFSSQYYFLLSIIALGIGTSMMGITICLRREYSPLGDPTLLLVAVIVVACFEFIAQFCVLVSTTRVRSIWWSGIWSITQLQGTMDDAVASKLAIGEGRQADLEREKQELQALNSETFRHKFMEKNRPWVLQHLVELFTPGSLPEVGPDGRPLVDYVRDVYSNLMHDGNRIQRHDDGSDVSSDDLSDEDEVKRRQWDHTPLEGNQLFIAQSWVQQARKQCAFRQAVAPIVEKRKEDHCSSCSRSLGQCEKLTAGLACNGRFDQAGIDRLIKLFEESYSRTESSPILWKAFFRENARFSTICNVCLDQIEQEKLHETLRPDGSGVPTRPEDISSDEESDDERLFGPVSVRRSSDEGRMLIQWLHASRVRLRGDYFPTTSGVRQTKPNLEKLNNRKPTAEAREDTTSWGNVDLNEVGGKLIKRWYKMAQQSRARNQPSD